MKKHIALFLLAFSTVLQAQTQDQFVGNWATNDNSLMIEIYTQEANYYARVVSNQNQKNNDKVVLIQMAKKTDTQLYGGTYYDDALKSEYEAKLKLTGDNTMRMKVFSGVFNKTILWHRVPAWNGKANEITVLH